MTYHALSSFAQTWGLLYFVLMFAAALAYALWPSNRSTFDAAANVPLEDREISDDR
ncbi:cbb3-type cytochrome c oxidase subunit 3 [Hirschia baltica]|uniref:Cbb3-type cytochrome oxidase component n=1 Tax=Hirschia baltica (strain ATCC 49814 / DSM 5838 / IFAM 1418) TaxID=582402 RepID=C6XJR6_HIRBI|nr:cbb3-type cytochrome c oxidase subunit 3 [Hirschia baltica]ACT59361.1 Cbb3-type cytochrome oxidase component [Hirschia baltica ATCC 49814]